MNKTVPIKNNSWWNQNSNLWKQSIQTQVNKHVQVSIETASLEVECRSSWQESQHGLVCSRRWTQSCLLLLCQWCFSFPWTCNPSLKEYRWSEWNRTQRWTVEWGSLEIPELKQIAVEVEDLYIFHNRSRVCEGSFALWIQHLLSPKVPKTPNTLQKPISSSSMIWPSVGTL